MCYNTDRKEVNDMDNFLFVDNLTGERFFVQAGIMSIVDDKDELEYIGVFSDEEAECMGYDTY